MHLPSWHRVYKHMPPQSLSCTDKGVQTLVLCACMAACPPRDVLFLCRTWNVLKLDSKTQTCIDYAFVAWGKRTQGWMACSLATFFPLKFINLTVLITSEFSLGFSLDWSPCRNVVKHSLCWLHVAKDFPWHTSKLCSGMWKLVDPQHPFPNFEFKAYCKLIII